jgi:pimeloyl-ACP methyl ester carboxylesterase
VSDTVTMTTEFATSADGTSIAFERAGSGPALVLVDGALCSRESGPGRPLSAQLADRFTVYLYDRRGRGESGDAAGSTPEREFEDLAAIVAVARETSDVAHVAGQSSGAGLVYRAAASGALQATRIAGYESPWIRSADATDDPGWKTTLEQKLAARDAGGAVGFFMVDMVGAPAFVPLMMKTLMRGIWKKLTAIAPTLPYDAAVMGTFAVPAAELADITTPTLVLGGTKGKQNMKDAVAATAAAIPGSRLEWLAGQTHQVDPKVLASALAGFFEE